MSSRQPVIFVGFDQDIDPEVRCNSSRFLSPDHIFTVSCRKLQEVIKCVSVNTSRWGGSYSVRLLTDEEVEESTELQGTVREKGRYLACQPSEPFRYDDQVTVKIGPKVLLPYSLV